MRAIFHIGVLWILLFSSGTLVGEAESLISYEVMLEDNPSAAHAWAREELKTINPDQDPLRYLHIFWLAFQINHPETEQLIPRLPEVLKRAEKMDRKEEWLRLKMHALRIERIKAGLGKDQSYFETMIADATRLNAPRLLARVLFDYAFYLDAKGDLRNSLRRQDEAWHILRENPLSAFDQAMLKNEMAILLTHQGQGERALPLMLDVAEYCEKEQVRGFAAVALYNLARHYDLKQTPADAVTAEHWFHKAGEAAQAIGDEESRASVLFGLGSTATTLQKWREADEKLGEALTLFRNQGDKGWATETLILLARGARLQKHPVEALNHLREAETLLDQEDIKVLAKWNEEQALALRDAGDHNRATHYFSLTLDTIRKSFDIQKQDDYQRRKVQMGLQVEEERNKVLQREAATYRRYFIVVSLLLVSLIGFISVAVVQTLRVRRSKMKMREILDHIEEGILTFDRHLKIEGEYSAYLKEFTQGDVILQGKPLLSTLIDRSDMHSEDRSMLAEVLNVTLGEERLSWEFNEGQLPNQLTFAQGHRIAALHWIPMFSHRGILERVLLTLRDVTEEKRLSERIEAQEAREHSLQHKVRELLAAPIPSVAQLIDDMRKTFPSVQRSDARAPLHTFKGVARSLGLKTLSQSIHALEGAIESAPLWQDLLRHVEQYYQLVREQPESRTQRSLTAVVAELLPAFQDQMQKAHQGVAACLVEDGVLDWPEALLRDVKNVLVHVLSNCADHGFIRPRHQAPARIQIQASRQDGFIEVSVRDNGAGLNKARLTELAQARNFEPSPGGSIYDIVFLEGFSTATTTDLTSGRGVGLAAVAALCRAWNGSARIEPEPLTGGTCLTLKFQASIFHNQAIA